MGLDLFPGELKGRRSWLAWKYEVRDGKPTKPPYNVLTGTYADTSDPSTWASFEEAFAACQAKPGAYAGLGFAFSADGGLVGIDLDKCRDSLTGEIEPWAMKIIASLNSYTEISPSGRGVHILVPGKLKGKACRKGKIEMYDRGRYFTVTGNMLDGIFPALQEGRQEILDELYDEVFGKDRNGHEAAPVGNGSAIKGKIDPDALLAKMFASRAGEKVRRLWDGEWEGAYTSASDADLALMSHLAFWCNRDPEAMREMFSLSTLGKREKWVGRKDYQDRTIAKGLEGVDEGYSPTTPQTPSSDESTSLESIIGVPITPMSEMASLVDQEIEYLLDRLLPKGALVMLQGQPKSGKSVFTLFLAMQLSLKEWRAGLFEPPKKACKVLILEYEDAAILVAKRLSRYLVGTGHGPKDFPANLLFSDFPEFYIDNPRHTEAMISYILENQVDLLIIDTLSHVHRADDENKSSDMKPAMAALKKITKKTGATVLVLHHVAKGSSERNISEKGRGSSIIPGAADVIIDWGDRKGTNITPVSIASKFGDSQEFKVQYIPMTDGSVEWQIDTESAQQSPRRNWRAEVLDEIKKRTLENPQGFPLSKMIDEMPTISAEMIRRACREFEGDGTLWASRSGGKGKTIRLINRNGA